MRHGVALALVLASAAFACGDTGSDQEPVDLGPDAATPAPDATPIPTSKECDGVEAEIGTGARFFEPVEDGDSLYLFKGPQGGFMIYIGVRAKGLDRSYVIVEYEERLAADDRLIGKGTWKVALTNDLGDGWYERVGIWGEIASELWTKVSTVRGHDVKMRVKLTDGKGCSIDGLGWTVHVYADPPT
jgi:hypothetical protein